ncbi:hypothetical protein BDV37DRAFT_142468 [Aspergillus pseudonomiae]|uniref:Uncharacterized protein n=1 Tax=Aspergillus pseudonomiae TaxID=1506151 RepID=A0A5N7DAU8_9EURO|nr:uncharacterized protein BDV37DRAFT_142468 [Aspergillus pseudonomiae]KAE8403359.1 hypothetical protein BDV37DRAFT_142468 [Aspergillus pseudonomiae]
MISEVPACLAIASQIHVSLVAGYGADWLWCALVPRLLSLVTNDSPVKLCAQGTKHIQLGASTKGNENQEKNNNNSKKNKNKKTKTKISPSLNPYPWVLLYHSFLISLSPAGLIH